MMLDAYETEHPLRQRHDGVPPVSALEMIAKLHGPGFAAVKQAAAIIDREHRLVRHAGGGGEFGNNLRDAGARGDVAQERIEFGGVEMGLLKIGQRRRGGGGFCTHGAIAAGVAK